MRYALAYEDRLLSLLLLDSMSGSAQLWQEEEKALPGAGATRTGRSVN